MFKVLSAENLREKVRCLIWRAGNEGSGMTNDMFCAFETVAAVPRKLRVVIERAIHHVMNRRDWRQPFLLDDEGDRLILKTLREA